MSDPSDFPRLTRSDGKEFTLGETTDLGRSPDCAIPLDDALASRKHARLDWQDGRLRLTDLSSRNGTWVNDRKLGEPADLKTGDRLRIGKIVFTVSLPEVKPPVPAPEPPKPAEVRPGGTLGWETEEPLALVRASDGAAFGVNRPLSIGRNAANDVELKGDTSASDFHAKIELAGGRPLLTDLSSRNGTWVNGKRITAPVVLRHGDAICLGNTIFRLREGEKALPAEKSPRAPARLAAGIGGGLILLLSAILLFGWVLPAWRLGGVRTRALQALVYVHVVADNGSYTLNSAGSGSLISPEGYILTNFHVVGVAFDNASEGARFGLSPGDYYQYGELVVVGWNGKNPADKPDTFYECEIAGGDPRMDLAVLRIVGSAGVRSSAIDPFSLELSRSSWSLNGIPPSGSFHAIPIGKSASLNLWDPISVVGYPGLGGDTPTVTGGIVSGFIADDLLNLERGWMKTDVEINSGNSGGMAINQNGELIGVPTWISASSTGKIGYIRPIDAALQLIQTYVGR